MTAPALPRVLVVDDDAHLLKNLGRWLSLHGYDPVLAGDAGTAMALAQADAPDVGIIDLHLPDLPGLALLARLKSLDPKLRLIVLTGHATVENAVAALRQGLAFDFLRKPLSDLDTLKEAVDMALIDRDQAPVAFPSATEAHLRVASLSEREREVIAQLSQGLQNKEIAGKLFVSEKTIRNHFSAIYRKLGVCTRMQALIICRDAGSIV